MQEINLVQMVDKALPVFVDLYNRNELTYLSYINILLHFASGKYSAQSHTLAAGLFLFYLGKRDEQN